MARSAGMSGLAVALAAAGGYLVFIGIRDVSFVEGLRQILGGTTPEGKEPTKTAVPPEIQFGAAGSGLDGPAASARAALEYALQGTAQPAGAAGALNARIANTALKYKGVPYKWGGTTPAGWDCSGFVSYVLNEVGLNVGRLTSASIITWNRAGRVPAGEIRAGDLLWWPGHVAIALSHDQMINAPSFGIPTRIQRITPNPVALRVKG